MLQQELLQLCQHGVLSRHRHRLDKLGSHLQTGHEEGVVHLGLRKLRTEKADDELLDGLYQAAELTAALTSCWCDPVFTRSCRTSLSSHAPYLGPGPQPGYRSGNWNSRSTLMSLVV